jgi:5-methylthioadenosine/S-adenosylhomocysteine deaminase
MNILIKNIPAIIGGKTVTTDIYIVKDTILSVGGQPEGFVPEKVIDGKNKLAIPALVNSHTHAYMSVFRNIADDLPFNEWLFERIMPLEDMLDADDAYWGCMLSCIEMIKSGTGTFCDMHMFPNVTPEVAIKCGMRAVVTRGLSGGSSDPEGGIRRINEAVSEYEKYNYEPLVSFMLAPHSIYTCDKEYLKNIMALAEKLSLPLNTHLSESIFEVENCLSEHKATPVEYLLSLGFFEHKTVAAHCVQLTERDIEILAEKGVSVAANPKSNLKLGNGVAPIKNLLDKGVNICLGTDSAASNNSLNLFGEMNYTALLHKGFMHDASAVSAPEVFRFTTENGAKALGLEKLGKIEAGYKADIAVLNTDCPQMYPMNNPLSALCYSANGSEVDTMIINGNVVMENRILTGIDEEEVYYHVEKITNKFRSGR